MGSNYTWTPNPALAPKQPGKKDEPPPPPPVKQDGGSATAASVPPLAQLLGMSRDPQTGSLGWQFPGAQRLHDILNRTENNYLLNTADPITSKAAQVLDPSNPAADLPGLRVQRARMNQQMPTIDKAVADYIGQLNPTIFLRSIPAVGPIVQGAVQEGVKGWAQGEDPLQILKDTAVGVGGGIGSGAISTPEAMGQSLGGAVTAGIPAAVGYLYGSKHDDETAGWAGLGGAAGAGAAGKYFLEPWAQAINRAGAGMPAWATRPLSALPLAGASYWNQDQRDRATLAGQ